MLKQRIKESNIRISDLSDYLKISRPTLYKYIESYENSDFKSIDKSVLKLFNYIIDNPLSGKESITKYLLNSLNMTKLDESEKINKQLNKLNKLIIDNPDSKKSEFILAFINSNEVDEIAFELLDIIKISNKKTKTKDDENKLLTFDKIKRIIKTGE
ncbi:MAG: hypothetical protein ACRC4M_05325 [Mycoplasma sp.]